jgi:hypothetical protein
MGSALFEGQHEGDLLGSLTCVDRLIIHGHLRQFWIPGAFALFLARQGLGISGFGDCVAAFTARIKAHVQQVAQAAHAPLIHLNKTVRGKDEIARKIAKERKVKEGLICVITAVELCSAFALVGGGIRPCLRKCQHVYFYLIHPELGFMHVRLQTWFPFQIQVWVNGHEWLARQLDQRRLHYRRYENAFLEIEDLAAAQRLARRFRRRLTAHVLDALARRYNPLLSLMGRLGFGSYYWAIDACEIATDVMWKSRSALLDVEPDLFDHAIRAFSADDVKRFLGAKLLPAKQPLDTSHRRYPPGDHRLARRRPEARRLKHYLAGNWLKIYDKWSVLRVETVINRPRQFRILRPVVDRRGRRRVRWMPMNKGIFNLWRFVEVGEQANRRYLDALANVQAKSQAVDELDALCLSRLVDGVRRPRFNPVAPDDYRLFLAVLAGEHMIRGFRSRDLRGRIFPPTVDPVELGRQRQRASRLIRKLRAHGLVSKVQRQRLYRVTARGARVMGAVIRMRQVDFPEAAAA